MELATIQSFLGWCALINTAILLWWFGLIIFAKNWIYSMHRKWFDISEQAFEQINYGGLGLCKLINFMFFVIPYLVLRCS